MGLIPALLNYSRQSEQDEMRRKMFEAEMADRAENRRLAAAQMAERNEARDRIGRGIEDIAEMSSRITQDKVNMARLEKQMSMLEQSAPTNPAASEALMMARVQYGQLAAGVETLEKTSAVRQAMIPYEMISSGLARAKAVDVIDALNGLQQKERADEPMVKIKSKRKGQEFGDEDEVTYEVPASMADQFIKGGGMPLPSSVSRPSGVAAQPDPINLSTYDTTMLGVAPASTGEQQVESSMLFSGGQSAQQSAASPNPFIQTRQPATRKRYNSTTGQLESY